MVPFLVSDILLSLSGNQRIDTVLYLHTLGDDHDPRDWQSAHKVLVKDRLDEGHVFTGLIYVNEESEALDATLNLPDTPLAQLGADDLRPSREAFEGVLAGFR